MTLSSTGLIAMVGSGEFLPPMADVDRRLLAHLTEPARVAIVPTASAPDGDAVFERWLDLGLEHFAGLGAQPVPVALRTRADAENPELAAKLAGCNFVYLSGGKPPYLRDALKDSPCWRAIVDIFHQGGVIAGCSAGAMVLAERMIEFPQVWQLASGLGLVPGIAVIPHFDEFGMRFLGRLESQVLRSAILCGVDGNTALVGSGRHWAVAGRGGVTVFIHGEPTRYTAGQSVSIGD